MNRRNRTVNDELEVEKITIYKFYKEQYKKDLFYVNRKYQRKLVWTLGEKKALIDTLFRKYPIPMFIIASYIDKDAPESNAVKWEIIDGLQRIDAIVSFINGDYAVTYDKYYGYFNLDAFTGYGKKISDGIIQQNSPVLPLEICEKFLDYELSFSVTGKDDAEVDEIFRRINSTGRKLSKQDLRQAGVTGCFSDLVRKTATYIRGDYTENDILKLSDISNYSLTNKDLPYGININDIFWIKQNIIPEEGIRRSKDEEIIAHIYIYLITKGTHSSSTASLESAYNFQNDLKRRLDAVVNTEDEIIYWMEIFSKTISILCRIFDDKIFSRKMFVKDETVYNKDCVFLILFCAIANLLLDGMILSDEEGLSSAANNLGGRELSEIYKASRIKWNKEVRNRLIDRIQNVIKRYFHHAPKTLSGCQQWDVKMINLLERAYAEEQMYDFKMGITDFRQGVFNRSCVSKIVKTLVAMVNTKPDEDGYVLLGIPDSNEDAAYISAKIDTNIVNCRSYKILGVRDEAHIYYGGVDNYLRKIKETIENEPIPDSFKNEILTKCHPIEYKDKLLYLFVCKSSEPVYYDKKLYVRYGSHNHHVEVGTDEFNTVMKKFYAY